MDSVKKRNNSDSENHGGFPLSDSFDFYSEENKDIVERKSNFPGTEKHKGKKNWRKIFFIAFLILLFLSLAWALYFVWKISAVSQKITIENSSDASLVKNIRSVVTPIVSSNYKKLDGEDEGRINILLLGAAGKNNPGKNLTDTIMVMSVNTETKKVALFSLPRDLYVNVPGTGYYTKINSIYQQGLNNNEGIEPIKKTVEEILNIEMHYFLVLDFEGFKKIIDDIGGINISVEKDIYDPTYPGPNYGYEIFEIKKGLHKMDGATALKYVRERHGDPEGDFGRAKRQQQVIQSAKNKAFSLKTFLNVFTLNKILNTLEENLKTNIGADEIDSFIQWSKQVDSQNIINAVADAWKKDSVLKVSHLDYNGIRAFILVPRAGNFSEVQDLAENIFDLDSIKRRRAEIEKEDASIVIINQSNDPELASKIRNLLTDKLNMKKVSVLGNENGFTRGQTVVYDNTSKEKMFTLDEIVKKLPARLLTPELNSNGGQAQLAENNADIVGLETRSDLAIILGTDLENIYKYEEDTMEDLNKAQQDNFEILNPKHETNSN